MENLHLRGHPFIDIGLVTLAVMSNKRRLSDLTEDDLRACAERLKFWYSQHNAARNYISVIFSNSHFTQPSMSREQRESYADRYLFAFLKDQLAKVDEPNCVFFPELAATELAYRQHIPLLNGEKIVNFSPMGRDGLPVSGLALLAIHAMPLGCLKCGGRLLGFHRQSISVDDWESEQLNLILARTNYQRNLQVLTLFSPEAKDKFPDFGGKPYMRYITQVLYAREELREREANLDYVTGYYFTNYGTSAEMNLIRLDHAVMTFVNRALLDTPDAWHRAVRRNWDKVKNEEEFADEEARISGSRRNYLYENLFRLPEYALQFVGNLKRALNWQLIEIFLKEVMFMDQERIDTYRRLGDLLADYAVNFENQPHSFYYSFSRANAYPILRGVIRSAAEKMYKVGADNVLFTYDDFINAFEHPSERYSQWKLARDLISVRILEQLHKDKKIDLSKLPDVDMSEALAEEETT